MDGDRARHLEDTAGGIVGGDMMSSRSSLAHQCEDGIRRIVEKEKE
jgi:hypothetical protein